MLVDNFRRLRVDILFRIEYYSKIHLENKHSHNDNHFMFIYSYIIFLYIIAYRYRFFICV